MICLRLFFFIPVFLIFASCGSKTYLLSDSDLEWVPYKGRDTLIFISNTGDSDTLFLRKAKRYVDYPANPLSLTPADSVEKLYIPYKFSYIDTTNGMKSKPEETLMSVYKKGKIKLRLALGL